MKKELRDFSIVFSQLKSIVSPYESKLELTADSKDVYSLNTKYLMKNKQYLFFAAVRIGKAYVSFHLMPVYVYPELLKNISPGLRRRMQGKSCFNFKAIDKDLLKDLTKLTKDAFNKFKKERII